MATTSKELSFDESIRPLMQYTTDIIFYPDKIFWEIAIPDFVPDLDVVCNIFNLPNITHYATPMAQRIVVIKGEITNISVRKAIESLYYKHGLT